MICYMFYYLWCVSSLDVDFGYTSSRPAPLNTSDYRYSRCDIWCFIFFLILWCDLWSILWCVIWFVIHFMMFLACFRLEMRPTVSQAKRIWCYRESTHTYHQTTHEIKRYFMIWYMICFLLLMWYMICFRVMIQSVLLHPYGVVTSDCPSRCCFIEIPKSSIYSAVCPSRCW